MTEENATSCSALFLLIDSMEIAMVRCIIFAAMLPAGAPGRVNYFLTLFRCYALALLCSNWEKGWERVKMSSYYSKPGLMPKENQQVVSLNLLACSFIVLQLK